jgi:hypothetical protein
MKSKRTTMKPAKAKGPTVAFRPVVQFKPVIVPLGNGNFELKSGPPIVTNGEPEITAPDFARETGLSLRYVNQLCDEGAIKSRRKSQKVKSHYLILRSELERFNRLRNEERS